MASASETLSVSSIGERREALAKVLAAPTFAKTPRLATLLNYLCERSFRGDLPPAKEYDIATDVFERSADFDQSTDAIVRVEMHRLRKKLKEHYARVSEDGALELVLPVGRYEPEFVVRGQAAFPPAVPGVSVSDSVQAGQAAPVETAMLGGISPELHPAPTGKFVSGKRLSIVAACLAVTCLLLAGVWRFPRQQTRTGAIAATGMVNLAPAAIATGEAIRIRCGATGPSAEDREGAKWGADQYFSGGSTAVRPDESIYRTRDALPFRSVRTGDFSYKIPLRPGIYELRLYFADMPYRPGTEMEGAENVRVFSVWMNDQPLLRDFDIAADAGPNTADIKVFKDVSPAADGFLHLRFAKQTNDALLNAIEIVPGVAHRQRPIRISTQDRVWKDREGTLWSPDNFFTNGRTIAHVGAVTGPGDPQLYSRERYGNFSYAIPVSEGRYEARFHFAETYWGPTGSGGGGAGSRLFDVYCNGKALLSNFDLFAAAGTNTQVVKTFENLRPNAQGKLLFSFVPVKNYAMVSAIEVLDEGE